nr:ORF2 [Drosophila melanogaster]
MHGFYRRITSATSNAVQIWSGAPKYPDSGRGRRTRRSLGGPAPLVARLSAHCDPGGHRSLWRQD